MFTPPENKQPGEAQDFDLDFTKPGAIPGIETHEDHSSVQEKIAELQNNIASTERGIELAKSLNDEGRLAQMQAKKEEFEATLAMLEQKPKEEFKQEFWVEPDEILGHLGADDRKLDRKENGIL